MVDACIVEQRTKRSFERVKGDMRRIAAWVALNHRQHELMESRILQLESVVHKKEQLIGSAKTRKVHRASSVHAQQIKPVNRAVFDDVKDARLNGFQSCSCVA